MIEAQREGQTRQRDRETPGPRGTEINGKGRGLGGSGMGIKQRGTRGESERRYIS